jgi:transcriptional regulator with XRE-family HTH domain
MSRPSANDSRRSRPAFDDAFDARLAAALGHAARQARRMQRMTQADAAGRMGITPEFYGRIERGHALPSVTTLARWVAVLDLDLDAIIGQTAGDAQPRSKAPQDPLPLRRALRRLRRATPAAREIVARLLDALGVEE